MYSIENFDKNIDENSNRFQYYKTLNSLRLKLSSFGLNPNDWEIEPTCSHKIGISNDIKNNNIELHHRLDSEIRFSGKLKLSATGLVDWEELTLAAW